jgi:hypothetical protein
MCGVLIVAVVENGPFVVDGDPALTVVELTWTPLSRLQYEVIPLE